MNKTMTAALFAGTMLAASFANAQMLKQSGTKEKKTTTQTISSSKQVNLSKKTDARIRAKKVPIAKKMTQNETVPSARK